MLKEKLKHDKELAAKAISELSANSKIQDQKVSLQIAEMNDIIRKLINERKKDQKSKVSEMMLEQLAEEQSYGNQTNSRKFKEDEENN